MAGGEQSSSGRGEPGDPSELRRRLRDDLVSAMKARQTDAVAALRTVLAALDNAEAVAIPATRPTDRGGRIAGASEGVGSTDVARRLLGRDEVHAILREQIAERLRAADDYDALAQHAAADQLRREAEVVGRYLRND